MSHCAAGIRAYIGFKQQSFFINNQKSGLPVLQTYLGNSKYKVYKRQQQKKNWKIPSKI